MGFSVSGSFAILVLASFIAFGMLYTAGSNGFERVTEATSDTHDDDLARQNTAIEITQLNYQDGFLEVNVTNRGTTSLSVNDTDLVLDNVYQQQETFLEYGVLGRTDSGLWLPGETLHTNVSVGTSPGRVKVITEHGVADAEAVP